MTLAERAWADLTAYKCQTLKKFNEIIPEIEPEAYRNDAACLVENMMPLLETISPTTAASLIHACTTAYSDLFAHRLVSIQPFIPEHPIFFLNAPDENGRRVQSFPWSGSISPVSLSYRLVEQNLNEMSQQDAIRVLSSMASSLTADWDTWAIEKITQIARYNREITDSENLHGTMELLIDRVSGMCDYPVNWLITNYYGWEEITKDGSGVEIFEQARTWSAACSFGSWNGVTVYIAEMPVGVIAMCGHRGNSLFDSGLVLSPYCMAEIDPHSDFFSTYFNVRHKPGKTLIGKATCSWIPGGESYYGVLTRRARQLTQAINERFPGFWIRWLTQ